MKKTVLGMLILTTVGVCAWFVKLSLPKAIAGHYVREIERYYDKPEARVPYDRLVAMGRSAVPTLLENALGSPQDDLGRSQSCPPQRDGLDWLSNLTYHRRASPKSFSRDACALALVNSWRDDWLSHHDMGQLLLLYEDHCLSMRRKVVPLDFDSVPIFLAYYHPFHDNRVSGELWGKRRIHWFVDEREVRSAGSSDKSSRWSNYQIVTAEEKPTGIFSGSGGEVSFLNLKIAELALGNHVVLARVELGPGSAGKREQTDDPPPWHVDCVVGPLNFEVVQDITITARSDPALDATIHQILDQWRPTIELHKRLSKLLVQFPAVQSRFPIPVIGSLTVSIDGKTIASWPQFSDSLSARTHVLGDLEAGVHTLQLQFLPDPQQVLKSTPFDEYWAGHYQSPVTEFELGPKSEILQVRILTQQPESDADH